MRRNALVLWLTVLPIACCHRPPHVPRVQQGPQPATVQRAVEAPVLITREFKEEPIGSVLELIAHAAGCTILVEPGIKDKITINFINTPWREAVETACDLANLTMRDQGNHILVEKPFRVTMEFKRRDLVEVINLLAKQAGCNVVIDSDVKGQVTMRFSDVPWMKALDAVVKTSGYTLIEEDRGRIIRVADPAKLSLRMETRIFVFKNIHPDECSRARIVMHIGVGVPQERAEHEQRFTLLDAFRNMLTRSPASKAAIGKLDYDKEGNRMIVHDLKSVLDRFAQIIQELDVPQPK